MRTGDRVVNSSLPRLLFSSASAFRINGRGTVIAGWVPDEIAVATGDVIEVRSVGRSIARAKVRDVEFGHGSSRPPPGTILVGILTDDNVAVEMKDDLEVWIVG